MLRSADKELLEGLLRGEFCYVLNTRQMGKSSLMVRTALRLREQGVQAAVIDLTAIGSNLTVDQWYFGMLGRLATQLGLEDEMFAFWKANTGLGPLQRLIETLRTIVVPAVDRLIIFIDEIDAVRTLAFPVDELFAGIRECFNRRRIDPDLERLTFCLLGVATPGDLIRDSRISPFNIGRRIELQDFSREEASVLAGGFGTDLYPGNELLDRVLYWTGGHPYMTQRLCRAVAEARPELATTARDFVDGICRSVFLNRTALECDDNLTFVRNRLLRGQTDVASLLDLYLQVTMGRSVRDDETSPACAALKLAGVVAVRRGLLRPRNRIYDHVFDREWVRTQMPGAELRRQRSAYLRGLVRAGSIGLAVVAIVGGLAATAAYQASRARLAADAAIREGRTSAQRLARLYVDTGVRDIEQGDYASALAPLSEAASLQTGAQAGGEAGGVRIAWALGHVPKLDKMWFFDSPVRCAAVSHNGRLAAAGCEDGLVRVWPISGDAQPPIEIRLAGAVNFVAFSPDDSRLVSGGSDGESQLWNLAQRRLEARLPHPRSTHDTSDVTTADWSRDGRHLVIGGYGGYTVWDVSGPTPIHVHFDPMEGAHVTQCALSGDGSLVAVVASNYSGWLVHARTGITVKPIAGPGIGRCYVGRRVEFSPDGAKVLVAGDFGGGAQNRGALLLPTAENDRSSLYLRSAAPTLDARFSPKGSELVTGGADSAARIWDSRTLKPITAALGGAARMSLVSFSDDGRQVLAVGADGRVETWDSRSGRRIGGPLHHSGAVVWAGFVPGSHRVLSAGHDGTVRLWEAQAGPDLQKLTSDRILEYRVLEGGTSAAVVTAYNEGTAQERHEAKILDLRSGAVVWPPASTQASWTDVFASRGGGRVVLSGWREMHPVLVWDAVRSRPASQVFRATECALSPTGDALLLRGPGDRCRLVDPATGKDRIPPFRSDAKLGADVFSPDGRHVLLARDDHASYHDVSTGKPAFGDLAAEARIWDAQVLAGGRCLLTRSVKGQVRLWDAKTGSPLSDPVDEQALPGNPACVTRVSPDGRFLLTSGSVKLSPSHLWDLAGSAPIRPVAIGIDASRECVFSTDGRLAVLPDQGPRVWDLMRQRTCTPDLEHSAEIRSFVFNPVRAELATASDDGTARLWDARTGRAIAPPMRHSGGVTCAAFDASGSLLASGTDNGMVRLWDAASGEAVTPPISVPGRVRSVEFLPKIGLLVVAENGTVALPLPPPAAPESIRALAPLLSGVRVDPRVGAISVEPTEIRLAWDNLGRSR